MSLSEKIVHYVPIKYGNICLYFIHILFAIQPLLVVTQSKTMLHEEMK